MRLLEVFISGIGLLLLSPLLAVISALVKLTSPGPVSYRAVRVGKDGRPFRLYKFRTMVLDAEKLGPGITAAEDQRITPVGRVLRRTKLDELPQLINVLRGNMGLVGPRPEDPRYVALYTPEQRQVLRVRPGITSPASLYYRDESAILDGPDWERIYVEQILPQKLDIELDYLARRNPWTDLQVIARTICALLVKSCPPPGSVKPTIENLS